MATRIKLFLIRADNDREAVMRLPVDQYGGITFKGHSLIKQRFFDGTLQTTPRMKYALCLEAFSNGRDIAKAIEDYYKNII